ncbi:MAG: TIGR03986 family CRISPR-associated RAMP protein [Bacteroidetes bacterium]|nr:TIGR03986 family CRISPR-associated RAMP protein [Bacteroidota bacterium]
MEAEEKINNSSQKDNLNVDHSIEIPDDVYGNINDKKLKINLKAFAPYNFIPLNDRIVPTDFNLKDVPFNKYHEERKTGYIELSIFTKTPIYLRGLLVKEDSERLEVLKKEIENLNSNTPEFRTKFLEKLELIKNFYSPGDKVLKLSGSSLRGLTRTLVEIASYSKIGFIDKDRKFHFRAMADKSFNLKRKYSDEMLDGDYRDGFYQKVKAGYLIKVGNNYKIKPVNSPNAKCQFFRVEEDTVIKAGVLSDRMSRVVGGKREKNNSYKMGFVKIKFTFEELKVHTGYSQPLRFSKVKNIYKKDDNTEHTDSNDGVLIHTGWMRNKRKGKHLHWVIGAAGNSSLDFLPGVIEDYENDEGRDEEANLLKWFNEFNAKEIPCFYLTEEVIEKNGNKIEKVKSFGHTGIFRLAYDRNLKDFIPSYHKDSQIDISGGIFGNETDFAGRVFFEDAKFENSDKANPLMDAEFLQILSNPKPTTFQHYLVQEEVTPKYNARNGNFQGLEGLKDYNSTNVSIRGNKLYWHKENNNWNPGEGDIQDHLNQFTKVCCVDSGTTFTGRIRFENLSAVELGALLFALDLPVEKDANEKITLECCHKIGMGKPLGLGSIRITPTLYLSKRKDRYKNLGNEWETEIQPSVNENETIEFFKNVFSTYILNKLGNKSEDLWEIPRMQELKRILDFKKKPTIDKTRYMRIQPDRAPNEFRNRRVLPKPRGV